MKNYIIKLGDAGYFSEKNPYQMVDRDRATMCTETSWHPYQLM